MLSLHEHTCFQFILILQVLDLLSLGITFTPTVLVPVAMDILYLEYPMFMPDFGSRYAALSY